MKRISCIVTVLLIAAAIATGAAQIAGASGDSSRVCFPASAWDAKDSKRPCAHILGVYEDGSVRVRVTDADGTPRYAAGIGAKDR